MVAPVAFDFNADAAVDNAFIKPYDNTESALLKLRRQVRNEFSALYSSLVDAGIQVQLFAQQEYTDTVSLCSSYQFTL